VSGTAYLLTLTEDDVKTIYRSDSLCLYNWAGSLSHLPAGDSILTEREAWEFMDSVYADMIGGHDAYASLARDSTLCTKLHNLYQSIV
jgi:hypothetical protein